MIRSIWCHTESGYRRMDAMVYGCWAVHTRLAGRYDPYFNGGFAVTHVPSGYCIDVLAADLSLYEAMTVAFRLDSSIKHLTVVHRRISDGWGQVVEAIVAEALVEARSQPLANNAVRVRR